jgi:hypothetical protein
LGRLIGYPLVLLSTLVHELGHGIAAWLTGGTFDSLFVYADTSGRAFHSGSSARAIVSAGGLVGPALAACVGFALGPRPRLSRAALIVGGLLLMVVAATLVRNPFGIAFTAGIALLLGYVGVRRSAEMCQLVVVFVAVQLALSVFSRGDYLFTDTADTASGQLPSDVAHMASALGGPFWIWGVVCGAFSLAVLVIGVGLFLRSLRLVAARSLTPRP